MVTRLFGRVFKSVAARFRPADASAIPNAESVCE